MKNTARLIAAATVVVVLPVLGCRLSIGSSIGEPPPPSPETTATLESTPTPTEPPPASQLPDLRMPDTSGFGPAGEYGWTGAPGSITGMHKVVQVGDTAFRQTQMIFAVESDCFARGEGPDPVPVTAAGLEGWYVEPYDDPGVLFGSPRGGETTGAYALPIADRVLCVYLTWDPSTTDEELNAARQVVESIRGQPFGPNGIRIVFTLPEDWDTG